MKAYNQAILSISAKLLAKLNAFQLDAAQRKNLRTSNKEVLALVEEMQGMIREVEQATRKNLWQVYQELIELAPARSWDVFNQRIDNVGACLNAMYERAAAIIADYEKAEEKQEPLKYKTGDKVVAVVKYGTEHQHETRATVECVAMLAGKLGYNLITERGLSLVGVEPENVRKDVPHLWNVSWFDKRINTRFVVTSYDSGEGYQTTGQFDAHQLPPMPLTCAQVERVKREFENEHRQFAIVPDAATAQMIERRRTIWKAQEAIELGEGAKEARREGFKEGKEVRLIDGRIGVVQEIIGDGSLKIRSACDGYSLTVSRDKVEPLIAITIYFNGREHNEGGRSYGMKFITKAAGMEPALRELDKAFYVSVVNVVYRNGVEVSQTEMGYCAAMMKIEALLKANGIAFNDKDKAVACLSECVAAKRLIELYQEEYKARHG